MTTLKLLRRHSMVNNLVNSLRAIEADLQCRLRLTEHSLADALREHGRVGRLVRARLEPREENHGRKPEGNVR